MVEKRSVSGERCLGPCEREKSLTKNLKKDGGGKPTKTKVICSLKSARGKRRP